MIRSISTNKIIALCLIPLLLFTFVVCGYAKVEATASVAIAATAIGAAIIWVAGLIGYTMTWDSSDTGLLETLGNKFSEWTQAAITSDALSFTNGFIKLNKVLFDQIKLFLAGVKSGDITFTGVNTISYNNTSLYSITISSIVASNEHDGYAYLLGTGADYDQCLSISNLPVVSFPGSWPTQAQLVNIYNLGIKIDNYSVVSTGDRIMYVSFYNNAYYLTDAPNTNCWKLLSVSYNNNTYLGICKSNGYFSFGKPFVSATPSLDLSLSGIPKDLTVPDGKEIIIGLPGTGFSDTLEWAQSVSSYAASHSNTDDISDELVDYVADQGETPGGYVDPDSPGIELSWFGNIWKYIIYLKRQATDFLYFLSDAIECIPTSVMWCFWGGFVTITFGLIIRKINGG